MRRLSEGCYPSLLWALIIMLLMGLPGNFFPTVINFWEWLGPDKIAHIFIFAFLSFFILWGYRRKIENNSKYLLGFCLLSFLIASAYGALTEILQITIFVGRSGNIYDFCADMIGSLVGVVVFFFKFKWSSINSRIN